MDDSDPEKPFSMGNFTTAVKEL
ncbi:uncharacterized protein METZ01_LOCUS406474 [marine metagenome]|uniref:Uncharacterized protein n=1 Tax=marine metagenome TaxID=408172 RepID=A0A382W4V0_9ZZZZ